MNDEPQRPLTAAEKACYHILRRVQSCPDFAWLMVGTESLDLVCAAIAEHRGENHADVKRRVEERAASRNGGVEVLELRRRVERLEFWAAKDPPVDESSAKHRNQISALEETLRLADLGVDVLRIEVLREVIRGSRLAAYTLPAKLGVG